MLKTYINCLRKVSQMYLEPSELETNEVLINTDYKCSVDSKYSKVFKCIKL